MARPRKPPETKRTYKLIVYLSTAEADAAFVAAIRARRDLSEHVRALLAVDSSTGRKTANATARHRPRLS